MRQNHCGRVRDMARRRTAFAVAVLSALVLACLPLSQGADPAATPLPTASPTLIPPPTPTLPAPTPTPAAPPTATAQPPAPLLLATHTATPTPVPTDTGWRPVARGIEVRRLDVQTDAALERIVVARLDPAAVRFRVAYAPGEPQLVSAWAQQTGALLVVNGGYFTPEYHATGLTVSGGETYGRSYGDYAGMFVVPEGGRPSVRWLRADPLDPREPLREAVECFPVLVKPGGVMGFPAGADDGRVARRTVVAQDRLGNLLFVIAPRGHLSLHALAVWLVASDLEVDTALNLDGGPSSGLWLADAAQIDSYVPVPAVIAVFSADG
jgi:uncharacterized protein YigE (DUF2233 family)